MSKTPWMSNMMWGCVWAYMCNGEP